ncbi:MAG: hypothetical protein H7Y00_15960 [Fimbriimonadaceae bacterium]|nr:hypothetical protein [Chitinophagales bacterium]
MRRAEIIAFCFGVMCLLQQSCKNDPIPGPEIIDGACNITDTVEANSIPRNIDTVYFQNDVYPILLTRCALSGCHVNVNLKIAHGEEIIFCSYDEIMSWENDEGEKLIIPFNTHDGKILEQITSTDIDHMMPPAPHEPLTSEEIDKFIIWVQQGALNNKCIE